MTDDEPEQPDQFTITVQKSEGLVTRNDDSEVAPLWIASAPGVKNPPIGHSPEDALRVSLSVSAPTTRTRTTPSRSTTCSTDLLIADRHLSSPPIILDDLL